VLFRRILLTGTIVWAAAIPMAALAASRPDGSHPVYAFALAVYAAGHLVCHQIPARSFHGWGAVLPVCARCTGIYAGAAITACAVFVRSAADTTPSAAGVRLLLIAALIPTAITLAYEWTIGDMPANWIRALAGIPLGAAVAWLVGTVKLDA
jgi:uncharacterized membrane protein